MPGIGNNSVHEFQIRLNSFKRSYVKDWEDWCYKYQNSNEDIPFEFGKILRRWQSCRPNSMRRTRHEMEHGSPYLEDLIAASNDHLDALINFDLTRISTITNRVEIALKYLWDIFENLSYRGRARNGRAGVVGISKAVLLLSRGCVGPAFDSNVQYNLGIKHIDTADEWIESIKLASRDITNFELANRRSLKEATPDEFRLLNVGRIYDMALGPN